MKKKLLSISVLVLVMNLQLQAQESIGYSEQNDFSYLLDYRLPDWGYSNFYISSGNFNSTGSYRFYDFLSPDFPSNNFKTDRSNHSVSLGLNPGYESYYESEQRTLFLELEADFFTRFTTNTETDNLGGTTTERDRNNNDQNFGFEIVVRNNSILKKILF